jgi:hypothetical protein
MLTTTALSPGSAFSESESRTMSQTEYAKAVAEFMRKQGVTRCPTACVVPTRANVPEADRMALRSYDAAREAARLEKQRNYQQMLAS